MSLLKVEVPSCFFFCDSFIHSFVLFLLNMGRLMEILSPRWWMGKFFLTSSYFIWDLSFLSPGANVFCFLYPECFEWGNILMGFVSENQEFCFFSWDFVKCSSWFLHLVGKCFLLSWSLLLKYWAQKVFYAPNKTLWYYRDR